MICEKCGGRRVLVISRDIVIGNEVRAVYYCLDCDERWEVIETWVTLSEA